MVTPSQPIDFEPIIFGFDRENAEVDYKRAIGWGELGPRGQHELIRDLMAFGNSDRFGYIVIGVRQSENGGFERTGISDEQAASYQPEQIGQMARLFSDPEVQCSLHTPELQGRLFVVLWIAPFSSVPHICRQSYDIVLDQAAIYVRRDRAQTIKVPAGGAHETPH